MYDSQDVHNLIDKINSIMEVHLVCVSSFIDPALQHEYPLLYLCIQRLINSATSLVLEYAPNSIYLTNLINMWSIIRKSYPIYQIQSECVDFILSFTTIPLNLFDTNEIIELIKDALKCPEKTTIGHLSKIIGCIKTLILTNTELVCEVSIMIFYFF